MKGAGLTTSLNIAKSYTKYPAYKHFPRKRAN